MGALRDKISYANVMATIAVFVALGGTGYAISQLPKDSVGSKQIERAAVKRADVAKNAIDTKRVKDGSLIALDFAAGQLPAGPRGELGPEGPEGPRGPAGPTAATFGGNGTPPTDPDDLNTIAGSLVTPSPGRILITVLVEVSRVNCNPDANGEIGLYIDGAPVAGSVEPFVDNTARSYNVSVLSDPLPAGSYNVQWGRECTGAPAPSFFETSDATGTALFIGG